MHNLEKQSQGVRDVTNDNPDAIQQSRRRVLQALSLAASGSAASCGKSDPKSGLSIEALRSVAAVHGSRLTDERLEAIRPSVDQQLARLKAVRGFDLDESVEPATVFLAKHGPSRR
jgi:hypothetical protein